MQQNLPNLIRWVAALIALPIWFFSKYKKTKKELYYRGFCFTFLLIFFSGVYFYLIIPSQQISEQQPNIKIDIRPINDPCISLTEFPQHKYRIEIKNKNRKSARVKNLNIEFFFPNTVIETDLREIVFKGEPARILGFAGCRRQNDGRIIPLYSEGKQELSYARLSPFGNGSNIAVLMCEYLPTDTMILGSIVIDLSEKPNFIERVYDIGKYRAKYEFDIGNSIFNKNLVGEIKRADTRLAKAEMHFNKGLKFMNQEDIDNAIINFDQALEFKPDHKHALKQRGLCHGKLGNHNLSYEDLSKYISLAPKDSLAYYNRGISCLKLNKCAEAKSDFCRSLELGNDKALKHCLVLSLPEVNPANGFIKIGKNNDDWLKELSKTLTIIPEVGDKDFKIHAIMEPGNVFRVYLSNSFSKNSELKFTDCSWLINKPCHPKHSIRIRWAGNRNKLYLDDALVDISPLSEGNLTRNDDLELFYFSKLRDANPSQGIIEFSISDPKLSDPKLYEDSKTKKINIFPHVYRNGIELYIYKDIDNILKVLMSNKYGNSMVLKFDDLDRLAAMPSHPSHSIKITWLDGKTILYIDDIIADIYPPNKS